MEKRRKAAAYRMLLFASQDGRSKRERREVKRADGKWRGSTVAGYLIHGDDKTFFENFRMCREDFEALLGLLSKSEFALHPTIGAARNEAVPGAKHKRRDIGFARQHTDPPTTKFKLATCLYAMGQGGRFKLIGDAASVDKTTVRKWMTVFCKVVRNILKPIYMPRKPFSSEELAAVQGQFASRRGFPNVTLACDGTHVPFHPRGGKKIKKEYRNYKGWHSILVVAFVDSYYRFFDVDVGFPGRAGDNTVLSKSPFMRQLATDPKTWLGEDGVILGDCGASDADHIFLNPYHNAHDPEKCWFNFCHSSTRFFVEQTFGIWKSKWRFLMDPSRVDHKLTSEMIYASVILHNFCRAHSPNGATLPADMGDQAWKKFFEQYKAMSCPSCTRRGALHCPHQAVYRNGALQQARIRKAPSALREDLCNQLWADLGRDFSLMGEDAERVKQVMRVRAGGDMDADSNPAADVYQYVAGTEVQE